MGHPLNPAASTGPSDYIEAIAGFATGVVVLTVRDGRDDLGTTISSFMSVSQDPPMVLVGVSSDSYLAEVLTRQDRWAATVLSTAQRALAGRFAAEGRPGARILLAAEPHHRGPHSEALIPENGLAALECETRRRVEAGDHILFVAEVLSADYVTRDLTPLVRVNRRYLD
ncbi:flavin reductase family protein [Actinomadura sp. 9N407]|uniref:flavin reductase family protein n=1 Tax=Actinomadura sp. 9N407 TaxID=3375154 RepID=UPI0037ADA8E8